ncbi:hypothetical protein M0R72_20635 [Candidatus Pacearchaeota archaeon]|jgi:hypothetical protein|nr:hypothetical protein [Candidatus Pacearchaeota archaeon]
MKEYILRFDELTGAIVGLEEIDEDPIGELEAVVVAMIKSLNERLTLAEKRIKELEGKPQATNCQNDTCLTINCSGSFDTDKFREEMASSIQNMFARFNH